MLHFLMNDTQVDETHDIDEVMSMYNLMEYSDSYLKTLEIYCNIVEMKMLMVQLLILL